jgi:hypothetical protein
MRAGMTKGHPYTTRHDEVRGLLYPVFVITTVHGPVDDPKNTTRRVDSVIWDRVVDVFGRAVGVG